MPNPQFAPSNHSGKPRASAKISISVQDEPRQVLPEITYKQENVSSIMIKLRLKRYGKKREASYRIVAMNSLSRRDGRPLEELGFYNPRTDEVRLDVPGIVKRLQQGAQPTDTVRRILQKANVFEQVSATTAS
ncbi:ribosomal protein S16 [Nostoc sp. PCC 7524]|nr:ribosomal protein S16 [Nostoc sp. PCC 7524]